MKWLVIICALVLSANAAIAQQPLPALEAPNVRQQAPNLITGGHPSRGDLETLKESGITTVINLQGLEEGSLEEAAIADELGLHYIALPVTGRNDLTFENAEKLDAALKLADGPTFLHCASSNRVGALMALRAFHVQKMSPVDALKVGKDAGLASLASTVEALIETTNKRVQ